MTEETVNEQDVGAEPVQEQPVVQTGDELRADAGEESGGGEDAAGAEEVNPFDFSVEDDDGEGADGEGAEAEGEGEGGGEEYVLDFGAAFGGSDEVRGMITRYARDAGITAEAGSRFISGVCEELRVGAQRAAVEGYKQLEEAWKGDFEVRMRGCKQVLRELVKGGVVSEEEGRGLLTPGVFKVVDALRSRVGEVGAVGTKAAATMSNKEAYSRIMSDPKSEQFQILMNPSHPKYRETADYVNRLAGARIY